MPVGTKRKLGRIKEKNVNLERKTWFRVRGGAHGKQGLYWKT